MMACACTCTGSLDLSKCCHNLFHTACALSYFQAKERICNLIQSGVSDGARLVLDGRNIEVRYVITNFVGGTYVMLYCITFII